VSDQRLTTNDLSIWFTPSLIASSLEKLRISSVEPHGLERRSDNLVASSPRIAKHAHVPMQIGSDGRVATMPPKYRPWHYREKILKIRAAMPPQPSAPT